MREPRKVKLQKLPLGLALGTIFLVSCCHFLYFLFPDSIAYFALAKSEGYVGTVMIGLLLYGGVALYQYSSFSIRRKRKKLGAKKQTDATFDYLEAINLEVYTKLKEKYPAAKKARVWLIPQSDINAFALGKKDICVYQGLIEQVNQGQLAAVLAHEYSHLYYRDTSGLLAIRTSYFASSLLLLVIFRWLLIPLAILGFILSLITLGRKKNLAKTIISLGQNIFYRYQKLLGLIQAQVSKQQEFRADEVAVYLGFGSELASFFEVLAEVAYQPKIPFLKMIKAYHPSLKARLKNIQEFE